MSRAPWGCCPRCGFQRRLSNFKKEWTGERVCSDCYDPKPAELKPPRIKPEGVPVPTAQPEPDPVFAKFTDGSHL
jgi:hypothetical protein